MKNQTQENECRCEETSCGCAAVPEAPCTCGSACSCASVCGCDTDCGC